MKSLLVAMSLLLAYMPVVGAEETDTSDFGIQNEVGEVVVLEGAEDTLAEDAVPNPEEKAEEQAENPSDNAEVEISEAVVETTDGDVTESVEVDEVVAQEEPEDDGKTKEDYDEEISYYIKNMNLSVEQLDMAKYISSDSRLKMDQLLKSIYLLRSQARELEEKSLNDFEAILTEEQKEQFHKLREIQEKSRKKFEVFDVQAMEADETEKQDQDAAESGENKPAK